MGYKSPTQNKNLAWVLPRPKKDHYKGGMPLYCEEWLLELAKDILQEFEPNLEWNIEKLRILNLFCGMNKYGTRVDLNPEVNPEYQIDAHRLTDFLSEKFDVILADPPYSAEEAKNLYGSPPLKYKKWTAECDKLLVGGGLLIVYHKFLMPNPNPDKYEVVKRVFIGGRPYHLPRIAIYFRKKMDS